MSCFSSIKYHNIEKTKFFSEILKEWQNLLFLAEDEIKYGRYKDMVRRSGQLTLQSIHSVNASSKHPNYIYFQPCYFFFRTNQ